MKFAHPYNDLREFINALDEQGKLYRIHREINKDTELQPLVRWQFRGLPEEARRGFLFDNVVDSKGRKFNCSVLVGGLAGSEAIYCLGLKCAPEEVADRWLYALDHPIDPIVVGAGPAQEEIHKGADLLVHGGLGEFAIPISTPGFDNAPYLSAANFLTKDPETGVPNLGNYRAMIKSQTRLGVCAGNRLKHLYIQWEKCRAKGIPLEAAIILGAAPNIGFISTAKIPYGMSEYAVAGGMAGEPVPLVKCKTVDLEVPATAEIVLEGIIPTDSLEREGPFGEYPVYMGAGQITPYFNLTCVTRRKKPIFNAFWIGT